VGPTVGSECPGLLVPPHLRIHQTWTHTFKYRNTLIHI
jgi:hypothetical protein